MKLHAAGLLPPPVHPASVDQFVVEGRLTRNVENFKAKHA